MRLLLAAVLIVGAGCGPAPSKSSAGPTVNEFGGKLTHDGKPLNFPEGENVSVTLTNDKGQMFGIPIQQDGSFQKGALAIGKYSVTLVREKNNERGGPKRYKVPFPLVIEAGKTEYVIELGKGWK